MRKCLFAILGALLVAAAVLAPLSACSFDPEDYLSALEQELTNGDYDFNYNPDKDTLQSSKDPAPSTQLNHKDVLEINYLDVGQGDSELIFLPDGTTILIDSGDRHCIDYIVPSLKDYGVDDIDILIATHPHADHIGCMATVVRKFDIDTIYMPKVSKAMTPTTVSYEKLLEAVDKKNLTVKTGKAGVVAYNKDGVKLEFLAPGRSDYDNLNNYSIVAKLTYDDTSFLFMGDAEVEILNEMLKKGHDLRCDVLKLGHHGSSNAISKKFLQAAQPEYGIISCGADNDYGHPHRETVKLLKDFDVTTYRTDEDGTIRAQSDGKNIIFTTGLPSVLDAA